MSLNELLRSQIELVKKLAEIQEQVNQVAGQVATLTSGKTEYGHSWRYDITAKVFEVGDSILTLEDLGVFQNLLVQVNPPSVSPPVVAVAEETPKQKTPLLQWLESKHQMAKTMQYPVYIRVRHGENKTDLYSFSHTMPLVKKPEEIEKRLKDDLRQTTKPVVVVEAMARTSRENTRRLEGFTLRDERTPRSSK